MKKISGLIMFGVAVATATAQGQQMDEEAFLNRISGICKGYFRDFHLPENARERALEGGVSPEWARETLEGVVRKNLQALKKMIDDGTDWFVIDDISGPTGEYEAALDRVTSSILILGTIPGPDTLALLRECISCVDFHVCDAAIDPYITIEGGNAVPFLGDILAKRKIGNHWLAQRLRWVIGRLKKKGRDDDVKKFHTFLLEQVQVEQSWNAVNQLDKTLCATLDDYPQSIQRRQAVQRFANMPENYHTYRQRYDELKAEIDAVPAGKRTDLSKRFKLPPPPPVKEKKE